MAAKVLSGLSSPQGVASDPQASPFIASGNGRILHLIGRNTAELLVDKGGQASGLAFDAAGDLYAADIGHKAVWKIKPWGEATLFADRCDGVAFTAPTRIAVSPNGDVYLTDRAASRVYRIDRLGQATVFTSDLRNPGAIVVSVDGGHLFIADDARRIWRFGLDGRSRNVFANLMDEGEPAGMALDEKGNLYIARDGGGKVSVLSPKGRLIDTYRVPGRRVVDIAFGGGDLKNLYITEAETGTLYKLRVPYRSQRLPWEPDEPLHITDPVDGAILNRHDGKLTAAGLRITVKGSARATRQVRINGTSVTVRNGGFHTTLLLRERENRIQAEMPGGLRHQITVFWDRDSFPRYRVSTDDNILFLKDIARHAGAYDSIFENAYLAFWRDMHRKYGAKVHFNIYYETEGFNLSQMPAKFRPEWQGNADWMHLTFHARANDPDRPYLHSSAERIRQDYRLVTREIARFAGNELLSPITTVHWGALTRAAAEALRAEGVRGLVGYFEARDDLPSVCYYLPRVQWRYMSARDYWKDMREDLFFIRIDMVINLFPLEKIAPRLEQVAADPHQAEIMELMIHEQYFYPDYRNYEPDYRQRVERAIEWVTRRGYKPVFYSDGFLGADSAR